MIEIESDRVWLDVNLRTDLDDDSANINHNPPSYGRFENGWIKIGTGAGTPGKTQTDNLFGNGDTSVVKTNGFDIPFSISKTGQPNVSGNVSHWSNDTDYGLDVTSGTLTTNYVGGTINAVGSSSTIVMVSTGATFNIVYVCTNTIPTIPFELHDDDEAEHPFTPDLSLLQESDSTNDNIFAAAYIRPVHIGAGPSIAPFMLNAETNSPSVFADQVDAGKDYDSLPRYWTVYIQGGFQGNVLADHDPDDEVGLYGRTFLTSRGGMVFVETIRDGEVMLGLSEGELHEKVVAHEIGHQFSLFHNELGGIMHESPGTIIDEPYYFPSDLKRIRETFNPAILTPQ